MADSADITVAPAGQALVTLADLNTLVNHEPRVEDLRLGEALGFERPRIIRDLIQRHRQALERLGEVCRTVRQTSKSGGRPGQTFWLNKRQCLYLCTKSETANATEVTIQMVEVFDEYLRGTLPAAKTVAVRGYRRAAPHRIEAPSHPAIADNQAVMRINGETVLVDLNRCEFGPDDRAVFIDSHGAISVEPVTMSGNGHNPRIGTARIPRPDGQGLMRPQVQVIGAVLRTLPKHKEEGDHQPKRLAPPRSQPRRFEQGSDIKRDLLLLVRSVRKRIEKSRALDLGQALAETLEDLIAREDDPTAPIRGAVLDWDKDRATTDLHRKMHAQGKHPAGRMAREVLH